MTDKQTHIEHTLLWSIYDYIKSTKGKPLAPTSIKFRAKKMPFEVKSKTKQQPSNGSTAASCKPISFFCGAVDRPPSHHPLRAPPDDQPRKPGTRALGHRGPTPDPPRAPRARQPPGPKEYGWKVIKQPSEAGMVGAKWWWEHWNISNVNQRTTKEDAIWKSQLSQPKLNSFSAFLSILPPTHIIRSPPPCDRHLQRCTAHGSPLDLLAHPAAAAPRRSPQRRTPHWRRRQPQPRPANIWGCVPRKMERAHPQNSEKPARNFENMFLLKRKEQVSEISLDTDFGTSLASRHTSSQQHFYSLSAALLSCASIKSRCSSKKLAKSSTKHSEIAASLHHLASSSSETRPRPVQ